MPFTGVPLSASKVNATPSINDHPAHHDAIAAAINDGSSQFDALVAALPELIRDTIGTALVAGTNVTIVVSDAGDTITVSSSGGGGGGTAAGTSFDPAGTLWVSVDLQSLGEEIDTTITARVVQGIIDARAGMSLAPLFIRATADDGPITADATLNNDASLLLTAIPVGVYAVQAYIAYDSGTTADFKLGFSHTGTMTMSWAANGLATAGTGVTGQIDRKVLAITDSNTLGATGGTPVACTPTGLLDVTVSGNLQFQWAQAVSDAANTTRKAGSYLMLTKVG